MTIKVCVSVPPRTVDEALCFIEQAEAKNADLIEIRLDTLENHDNIGDIQRCSKTPLIATNKTLEQQGNFSGSETENQKILMNAVRDGFEYVDLDLSTTNLREIIVKLHEAGAKPIVSFHDYERTPTLSRLNKVLEEEIDCGAEICKIVTTAINVRDNLTTLDFVSKASKKAKIVCFAMGELGKPSRLLSPVFGALFTFASIDKKRKTAKGQLTIQEMRLAFDLLGLK